MLRASVDRVQGAVGRMLILSGSLALAVLNEESYSDKSQSTCTSAHYTMVYARSNVSSRSEITAPQSIYTRTRYLLLYPINKKSL